MWSISLTISVLFLRYGNSRLFEETKIDEELQQFDQGKHRVSLYHEWNNPVEKIETLEAFQSLVPKRKSSSKTENNIVLGLYKDSCASDMHNVVFEGAQYESGPGILHLAIMNKQIFPQIEKSWKLPQNCSHFLFIPKHLNFEDYSSFQRLSDASSPEFIHFLIENRHVDVHFRNNIEKPVDLYWYEDEDTMHLSTIEPGDVYESSTLLGHAFIALDTEDEFLIDYYLIDGDHEISIQEPTLCKERGIEDRAQCNATMRKEMWEWMYEFWARKREILNFIQPKLVHNFTLTGFGQTRLDDDLFQSLSNFWKTSKENGGLLEEGTAGPVMNQQKSPTFMVHLGDAERAAVTTWIKPKLEKWSNLTDLELTSLYGIRMYTRGAILGMHVDTCNTHVISAIINVDSKVDDGKDWPLQIYDHSGQLHEFSMVPGDVIFYESAKNGHARFKPLPGEYYANIFIHFKPTDSQLWDYEWF